MIGQTIKEARSRLGLNQGQLAERVGMTRSYICKLERGKLDYPPTESVLGDLALLLDLDKEALIVQSGRGFDRLQKQIKAEILRQGFPCKITISEGLTIENHKGEI